jgi:nicotinamidase-related amidase
LDDDKERTMAQRVWDPFLTEQDRAHLAAAKPKVERGFGVRPAVLSVDNYRAAIGDEPKPILEAIKEWPSSTGLAGWKALERISELFATARASNIPIIHITGLSEAESGIAGWRPSRKIPGNARSVDDDKARRRYEIVEQAAPLPGEVVLKKTAPSAFFGTPLAAYLIGQGIDTLIVCGEAVSGCIRATVVDGCSHRLRMVVVEDCAYDRHEATRAMNLFDIDQKYGDVVSLDEVSEWMRAYAKE